MVFFDLGKHVEAARLLGAAERQRELTGYVRPAQEEADLAPVLRGVAATLGGDGGSTPAWKAELPGSRSPSLTQPVAEHPTGGPFRAGTALPRPNARWPPSCPGGSRTPRSPTAFSCRLSR